MYKIEHIGQKQAGLIIANRQPYGMYILQDGVKYVAIDNTTGDCWVEEFTELKEAERWLKEVKWTSTNLTKK